MTSRRFLLTVCFAICGTLLAFSQTTQLSQITAESQIVSGRLYKLFYVSNSTGCYVKAGTDKFSVTDGYDSNNDDVIYYFIKDGDKWKIQSKATSMYFPIPTSATNESHTFTPTEETSAGLWTLNFLEGKSGIFAPYCHNSTENADYSLNRYNSVLHGWTKGEANVNQFKIYEWVGIFNADGKVYTLKDASQWMLIPAGGIYYYLYNTSTNMFAYPSSSGNWETKNNVAVPLRVVKQGENTYQLSTKDGTKTFTWNNQTDFEIVESAGSIPSGVYANLLGGQTSVTTLPTTFEDGWYALRISSDSEHPEFDGNFLYTLDTPYGLGTLEYPYPIGHGGTYDQNPSKDNAMYYFHLWKYKTENGIDYYHWQLPNGFFIVNYQNNYPIRYHLDRSDFIIGQNGDGTYYIQSSGFRTKAYDGYIGKTAHKNITSSTKLGMHKVDLSSVGLTPWKVKFNDGADEIPLTCTRTDVKGPTTVYNKGYFFLPTGVTPTAADFDTSNSAFAGSAVVNTDAKTITVKYAPDVCFTADDVTVTQGSRTAGVGNEKQVLLRTKIVPQAPCTLSSLAFTLAGAEQFSQVEVYLTTADQLHAEGVTATLLGSKSDGLTGDGLDNISISTTGSPVLKMNESYYVWLTADIVNAAGAESEIVDAAIVSISYVNGKEATKTVDVSAKGDPDGNMRIFKHQSFIRVSTENNGTEAHYYRNPAILNIADNTVLAFYEDRYDNPNGLGKDYNGSNYGHRIDVKVRKSTDNGVNWSDPVAIGTGTDATETTQPSGFAGPAVVKSGSTIICLMAQGTNSYDAGLTSVYKSTSSDGASWTTPTAININWSGVSATSYYVTPGKGIVYSDGHVAFTINAKVGGSLKEYLLYSSTDFSTWTVDPTPLNGKGKESKLELKNDGNLLVMGKTPASKECNNDLLYFKRSGEESSSFDAILQTVMWKYENERLKDLRLYVTFDQASTWKELFNIQPGNAATNSMQRLTNGNHLAICFEDGSIGNDENGDCYALTYVVIDNAMIQEQSAQTNTATIVSTGLTDGSAPYVNGSGWTKSVITNTKSGFAGITISTGHTAFNRENANGQRVFDMRPSAAGASDVITITAPSGYVIKSYTITGYNKITGETYTLTAGNQTANFSSGVSSQGTLTVDNIFAPSTSFTFANSNSTKNSYALITNFTITLTREEYGVTLHQVNTDGNGDSRSYATLFVPYDLRQADDFTKAYYVTTVDNGSVKLTETNNEGRDIPKNTAVVLINSQGSTYAAFSIVDGLSSVVEQNVNLLKGTLTGTTINLSENSLQYSLGRRKEGNVYIAGFYHTGNSSFSLGANRAYLDLSGISAPCFGYDLLPDENTTGIHEVRNIKEEVRMDAWYTLDGRRINGMPTSKGIYIHSGKKIIIR